MNAIEFNNMAKRKLPESVLETFRRFGRDGGIKGGSLGGKAAAANLTKAQRVVRARKAGRASGAARKKAR